MIDPIGAMAAVGANVSFALGVVLTEHLTPTQRRVSATGWQLLSSSLILVPLALLIEGAPPQFTATNPWGFAYLSLVTTGLAFVIWFAGIRNLPTPVPPLLGLAAPLTGAVLGWLLLGESLAPSQIAGFTVSVSAVGYGAPRRAPGVAPSSPHDKSRLRARPPEVATAVIRLPSSPASRDCLAHPAPTSA